MQLRLTGCAGDPEMRGFIGDNFVFDGEAGSFYEALGGAGHQVNLFAGGRFYAFCVGTCSLQSSDSGRMSAERPIPPD
jgi:hypothetical protein